MTIPLYELEPRCFTATVEVVTVGTNELRPFAVLDRTIFYPEGGGQPCDRGTIAGVAVLDVQRHAGQIRHYLAAPLALGPAVAQLDAARRFDFMQQHSGQHLLTAIAHDRFGLATTAFHLGDKLADIEIDQPNLSPSTREALEDAVAAEIRAALPITARRVSREEFATLHVRSRGLPHDHLGDIRLVAIGEVDLNTCGGTHLANTAEIELITLVGTERMRGGTRLFFQCGTRARRRLSRLGEQAEALRRLWGAGEEELLAINQSKQQELVTALRREKTLRSRLAELEARMLAQRIEAGIGIGRFDGAEIDFLQQVARQALALQPSATLLLCGSLASTGPVLFAAGEASTIDPARLWPELAARLAIRGGGRGRSWQGSAERLAAWDDACAWLRADHPA